ncbi:hypothetical protein RB213_002877 [Colletotrichum asianum]
MSRCTWSGHGEVLASQGQLVQVTAGTAFRAEYAVVNFLSELRPDADPFFVGDPGTIPTQPRRPHSRTHSYACDADLAARGGKSHTSVGHRQPGPARSHAEIAEDLGAFRLRLRRTGSINLSLIHFCAWQGRQHLPLRLESPRGAHSGWPPFVQPKPPHRRSSSLAICSQHASLASFYKKTC